jgi:hypothetical protein
MKKILVLFSLMVFIGVYAVPAITMPKDAAAKIVAVDKDKKVKATKTAQKTCCDGAKTDCCKDAKAGCCDPTKADCCKDAKAGCCKDAKAGCCESSKGACCGDGKTSCSGTEGFSAACATACQGAAAIKGTAKAAEKK